MANQSINVSVSLNGLRVDLLTSLQEIIRLVALGFSYDRSLNPNELALPTFIKLNIASIETSTEQFAERYSEWILANGLRDAIESLHTYLESSHKVLSIWDLVKKQRSGETILAVDLDKVLATGSGKFHRLGLPGKLGHLANNHEIMIEEQSLEQLLSINIARNCLVHRAGKVSDRDLNFENTLVVKWKPLHIFLTNEDGEHELIPGVTLEKESTVCIRQENREKVFALGDDVLFSAQEISEILWSLVLFGNDFTKSLNDYGLENDYLHNNEE